MEDPAADNTSKVSETASDPSLYWPFHGMLFLEIRYSITDIASVISDDSTKGAGDSL